MTNLKDLKLQFTSSGARMRLDSLEYDEEVEEMTSQQLLAALGVDPEEEYDAEAEINEAAAAQVRDDVRLLLEYAPLAERELLGDLDALLIDGAVEAVSNVFRTRAREAREAGVLTWLKNQEISADQRPLLQKDDLQLTVARYLNLWSTETSDEPADSARRLVTWARRAAVRAPELFRHAKVIDITEERLILVPQPRDLWSKPRRNRWSVRCSVPPML